MILPIRGDAVYEKWIAFAERLSAEWRWINAGFVSTVVALVAYAWVAAASPRDPDAVKEPSRRW